MLIARVAGASDQRRKYQRAGEARQDGPSQAVASVERDQTVDHTERKTGAVRDVGHVQHAKLGQYDAQHEPAQQNVGGRVATDRVEFGPPAPADPQHAEQPVNDARKTHNHPRIAPVQVQIVAADDVFGHHRHVAQQHDQPQGAIGAEAVFQRRRKDHQPVDVERRVEQVAVHQGTGERPPQFARPKPRQDAQVIVVIGHPPPAPSPSEWEVVKVARKLQRHGHRRNDQRDRRAVEIDFRPGKHGGLGISDSGFRSEAAKDCQSNKYRIVAISLREMKLRLAERNGFSGKLRQSINPSALPTVTIRALA